MDGLTNCGHVQYSTVLFACHIQLLYWRNSKKKKKVPRYLDAYNYTYTKIISHIRSLTFFFFISPSSSFCLSIYASNIIISFS